MAAEAGELLEKAIAAHGGRQLWEGAREIRVRVSSGGLAFASKLQGSAVRDVEAQVSTRGQRVVFTPYPRARPVGRGWRALAPSCGDLSGRRAHALPRAGLLFRRGRLDPPPRLHGGADRQLGQGRSLLLRAPLLRGLDASHAANRLSAP